ncbi:MAG: hypothetical protein VKK04_22035 [Synechococcales bacterium]|nr:hypothetical protein [Synechococcales bacterium]
MNEHDSHLKELALEAQRHPQNSRERRKALTRLLRAIEQSRQLSRPRRDQFQGLYEEIYADAVQRLYAHICDRIDTYSAEKGEVLQWANFLLSKRFFIEASRELLPTVYKGMDARAVIHLTLEDLDRENPQDANPHSRPLLSQEVRTFIEDDPDQIFQTTHVADRPDASFQLIALRRLDGFSWQEISAALGIRVPTLSSFYQRTLTRLAPKLKEYLS